MMTVHLSFISVARSLLSLAMPEQHHKTRNQNYPEPERRDRDYRRDRGNESYREDRSTSYHYEDRTRNYRQPEQEV